MTFPYAYKAFRLTLILAICFGMFGTASAALFIDGLHHQPLPDFDIREPDMDDPIEVAKAFSGTAAQVAAIPAGATVRWNYHGTPATVINYDGFLATGLSTDPETAARAWLVANAALFGLAATDMAESTLELYHVGEFAHSAARAVKFRQNFDGLAAQGGGLVTVGVIDGQVSIVTSSLVKLPTNRSVPAATIGAATALLNAAADIQSDLMAKNPAYVGPGVVTSLGTEHEWNTFELGNLNGKQRVRSMSFPTETGIIPVHEVWLVTSHGGGMTAYMHLVDATSGAIVYRQNKLFHAADFNTGTKAKSKKARPVRAPQTSQFNGEYSAPPGPFECDDLQGPFTNNNASALRIVVQASSTIETNDIEVFLYFDDPLDFPDDGPEVINSTDVGFGEILVHEPGGVLPTGDYFAQVCPLEGSVNQNWLAPFTYQGTFTIDDTPAPSVNSDPRWKYFESNPAIDLSNMDIRELGCWQDPSVPCDFTIGNLAARAPWDWDFNAGAPTNTTVGNGAVTGEAWLSPLTPAESYKPIDANRNYDFPWVNAWYSSPIDGTGCNPSNFVVGVGNDIDAAVVNMFADHNWMHDWSYYLGFTEANSNFQTENFDNTDASRQNDPVFGNVQAGAIDGAYPAYLGRDNANFVPLPDGAPGVTNQYLWQALRGAIYTPCADGNYDMGIVGHEIGHGIQHRMTGGPSTGLGGNQGGRMGESWGDLTGMEIQNEFGSVPTSTESPFAIGVYVLGSPDRGIRNYNMSNSPLNYSDIQYDPFGNSSPHADGEIWSAVQFEVRQAFIDSHEGTDPSTDAVKQRQCAYGLFAPGDCPGNRRYIQIMHDGFLLQPAAPSYVDARDAQLAADMMRFAEDSGWGDHQDVMWLANARRGLGFNAASNGSNDLNPTADFSLPPGHPVANATVDFSVLAKDESDSPISNAQIFIGHFQARANPVATTDGTGTATATIAPGTYDMLARANGHGHMRFSLTLTAGQTGPITLKMPTNFASQSKGATASGDGSGHNNLIDDSEVMGWSYSGTDEIGVNEQVVSIDLGGTKSISRVQVSALAQNGQNRYENLRQFAVEGCNSGIVGSCTQPGDFSRVFTSDIDAFNGQPIRPLTPNLIIQNFDLPQTILASHLRFVVLHNQCTGSSEFTRDDWATGAAPPDDLQDCRDDLTGTFPMALPSRNDIVRASEFQAFGSDGEVISILDTDLDGIPDIDDNCPLTPNNDQMDQDEDLVGDVCDNCLLEFNPDQCNTNAGTGAGFDQIGNVCDADLDNNNIINTFDLGIMRSNFSQTGANDSDVTCNGIVNTFDLTELRNDFGQAPGPTGISP